MHHKKNLSLLYRRFIIFLIYAKIHKKGLGEGMKFALVHDWLPFIGGAERVLTNFVELYPSAPIYTTICNKDNMESPIKDSEIIVSSLQKNKKEIKIIESYFLL